MKKIFFIVLFIAVICSYSQPFTEIDAGFAGISSTSADCGDYDNDGDLDVLLLGSSISTIYRNDSGVFKDINAGMVGGANDGRWGDYDNDGDLDIALCGSGISKIYRNDSGVFTDINAALIGVSSGSISWGDYDRDGDLDLLLTGLSGGRISYVYRNDSGIFTNINAGFIGVYCGSAEWGDYDNDGDLDVLLSGNYYEEYVDHIFFQYPTTILYQNNGDGIFNIVNAGLQAVLNSHVAWGDYDNDGDLDILLTGSGYTEYDDYYSIIYRNDAGVFTNINSGLTGIKGKCAWGDYNNDGELDVMISGSYLVYPYQNRITQIFQNENGIFSDINAGLTGSGPILWGDYDKDGDLDILRTGSSTSIFRNNSTVANLKPSAPTNLISELNGTGVVLSWDKASDNETPQNGLSYNIYIGTASQTGDICNPMSNIYDGNRKIVRLGNVNQISSFPINQLANGEYFWSVQAIDHAFAGSEFAPESSFIIDIGLPSAPVALDADAFIHSFNANWVVSDTVLGYYLDVATDIGFTSYVTGYNNLYVRKETGYTVIGLDSDLNYYYRVRAYNANGYSSYSDTISLHTIVDPFSEIILSATGLKESSVAWGDYDNDYDLDILLTGNYYNGSNYSYFSKIYRNDSGIFTDINAELTGVSNSSVAWGDYDNDGDLDILLTGFTGSDTISKIYRNDSGVFTDIIAGLTGVNKSSALWSDYDCDGDLDILLSGSTSEPYNASIPISVIYRNDNGTFIDINAGLTNVSLCSAAWGDYDNDGDLDLLLSGLTSTGKGLTKIYCNDSSIFTDINAGLTGVWSGSVAWGDYDNDGDLDMFLTGYTGSTSSRGLSKIYRNDSGAFTDINAGLTGVYRSSVTCGDYDNDGDLDILITGLDNNINLSSTIYSNNGNNDFTDINSALTGIQLGSVASGDYDNDGDLDILISGLASSLTYILKIYKNNSITDNTKPNPPTNLSTDYTENGIVLSWDKATDAETPQDGLSYNIYIGSTSQTENIYSPMSDIFTGFRKIVSIGNANQNTSWTIKDLPTGEYFWSVQAIDHCFAGSEFAPEQYFTSIEGNSVPLSTELYQNYPNPFNPETVIKYSLSSDAEVKLVVYDISGREVTSLVNQNQNKGFHESQFNAERLTSGMYFYRLSVDNKVVASKKMMMLK